MPSSKASETFGQAIQDAENLLAHFNKLNTQPPPAENEVLKRAGLIMAMTAWETFVEDRLQEFAALRLAGLSDSSIGTFVQSKLDDEISDCTTPRLKSRCNFFVTSPGLTSRNTGLGTITRPNLFVSVSTST